MDLSRQNIDNKEILDALEYHDFSLYSASESLDLTYSQLKKILRNRPDLELVIEEAKKDRVERAEDILFSKVKEGDMSAIKFFLENKNKEFEQTINLNHNKESEEILKALERKYVDDV